jgi:DnaJ family protein C protein 28
MDSIDYRKTPEKRAQENRYSGRFPLPADNRRYYNYVEEQIRDAQERGDFDRLPGSGKPLDLASDYYAGDRAQGYRLLKSNGYAPFEIELAKEIRNEVKRMESRLARVHNQGQKLRSRRVPPFPSEKRAYNAAVEKMSSEYAATLRELNRKILTLNVSAPSLMHRPLFDVERQVHDFRAANPLFESGSKCLRDT